MTHTPLRCLSVLLALAAIAPVRASAQQTVEYQEPPPPETGYVDPASSGPERVRLALHGGVHWAGQALQQSPGFTDIEQALGPAPTFGARLELPLGNALVLGGYVDFLSIQMRDPLPGAERVSLLGAGLWVKLRMIATLERSLIELYLGIPLGVSIWIPPSSAFDTQAGLALGFLGGAQAHITPRFAIFVEAGFKFDYFNVSNTQTSYFQASAHAGLSFGF